MAMYSHLLRRATTSRFSLSLSSSSNLGRAFLTTASCYSLSPSSSSVAPTSNLGGASLTSASGYALSPSPSSIASVSTVLKRGSLTEATRAPARLFSTSKYKLYDDGDEITENTVLFEGCDYKHWLIAMDFPKDNPLSPEEMVSTYENTCAAGLGIRFDLLWWCFSV